MTLDYITSEKFIHDDLVRKSQGAVNQLYAIWGTDGRIDPSLLTWPAETIMDDHGRKVEGVCILDLPHNLGARREAIHRMVERTKAYGLLLIETIDNTVQALLETPHGAQCWTIPIHKSADSFSLGEAIITRNREHVGVLWSPIRAVA